MKRQLTSVIVLALWLPLLTACRPTAQEVPKETTVDTISVLVTQIQQCSRLYTAEYQVRKIITHEDERKIDGSIMKNSFKIPLPMGKRRIAIPIEAKVKAYIDFADFAEANVHKRGEKIEIVLPDPRISMTSTKIARDEVHEYVPLLRSNFTDEELTQYEKEGRQAIVNDIPQMGIIETAQANAAKVLVPMLTELGYDEADITIAFRKHYGPNDIMKLLRYED